jgi:hypothetical protein
MSRTSGQRAIVGRALNTSKAYERKSARAHQAELEPLSTPCEMHDGYETSHQTVGETDINNCYIECIAGGEFLNPAWNRIYFLSPLKT